MGSGERGATCELFRACRRLPVVRIRQFSTREIREKDQIDFKGFSGTRLPSSWNLNQGDLCPLTIKGEVMPKTSECDVDDSRIGGSQNRRTTWLFVSSLLLI